ncbi:protein ORF58A [Pigeon adenovirus 1]
MPLLVGLVSAVLPALRRNLRGALSCLAVALILSAWLRTQLVSPMSYDPCRNRTLIEKDRPPANCGLDCRYTLNNTNKTGPFHNGKGHNGMWTDDGYFILLQYECYHCEGENMTVNMSRIICPTL